MPHYYFLSSASLLVLYGAHEKVLKYGKGVAIVLRGYKSVGIGDEETHDSLGQSVDGPMPSTSTVAMHTSQPASPSSRSSHNDLISELQNRIGGSNKSALQLLEQLKRSLASSRGVNIHLNPELIRNSP
ncbi:hypothetical protein Tcan_13040 [Toxocara canis]|uniref:Uncharacterized protein n=2 Tax=Toxocara canis TaxID=6265 RepID=A0A0B2UWK0_TOXCA|nr:hypothetical protein Tcan_13040 [Toxocara canis]VDM37168.1 unnamed protein product [Toxocara canis]